jgi:hypothetical protein
MEMIYTHKSSKAFIRYTFPLYEGRKQMGQN